MVVRHLRRFAICAHSTMRCRHAFWHLRPSPRAAAGPASSRMPRRTAAHAVRRAKPRAIAYPRRRDLPRHDVTSERPEDRAARVGLVTTQHPGPHAALEVMADRRARADDPPQRRPDGLGHRRARALACRARVPCAPAEARRPGDGGLEPVDLRLERREATEVVARARLLELAPEVGEPPRVLPPGALVEAGPDRAACQDRGRARGAAPSAWARAASRGRPSAWALAAARSSKSCARARSPARPPSRRSRASAYSACATKGAAPVRASAAAARARWRAAARGRPEAAASRPR